ncbi:MULTISPECIES: sugar ABC transporter permease [Rhizobium/Agrobacterium group]|jgi:putative aldouronate transport system permease protein|uniref:Sugar ABC transporter permease n=2 Tax=Rhizobium/Agrobacterium group TaxID=227290 RepID=A0A546XB00_RHIRH|nr:MULTISPECIES: sugar ABC transporter permease [Rhizobium/Agrobacterium group]MCZ7451482.1 sugar ABC transporter permease [Rhizobium rhizogenes]MCZ7465624.1 sugar ABC transporter permease [Rhizobium rhizogenes]MCZ7471553.1 sugar ABC transporter permease [Rhizobium rhizogenes]MCZ7482850.1 sugar ABC transporter permease [Rhizobium rhizogenes]MCZ7487953.1 sugar ABC transporter permease [Rhizobium rhizogenes]
MKQDFQGRLHDLQEDMRRDWQLYLLLAPMLIWFAVFLYKPMYGLVIAFQDFSIFRGIEKSPWVGFANFVELFQNDMFIRSFWNTITISGLGLIFAFPVPIILALMFNEIQSGIARSWAQTVVYLPHFISVVIVAGIVINFLSPSIGIVNLMLKGLGFEPIYFLTQPEWFRPVYIGSSVWKEAGFESIVYLAAIAGVSPTLYESARVDGASRWQMMWRITLPCILPTIVIMLIIRIGNLVEVGFEYIILLYRPSTYETADVVSTFIYRTGLQGTQYDLATAAGLFNAVIAFVLVYSANRISRKVSSTSLW